ncbi:MAG TPA: hypothetical protein VH375_03405 [Rhodanobacteraceae bacterium]
MDNDKEHKQKAITLIKSVAVLQVKVLIGAARDLALGPAAIVAGLIDLILLKHQEPQFFRAALRFGERTDRWIDVWSGARSPDEPRRENVDALIARVEDVVRDPQQGARHARVLKRWAERQVARAGQRAAAGVSARLPAARKPGAPPGAPKSG